MNFQEEARIVESILFMENEPVDIGFISRVSRLSKEVVEEALKYVKEEYDNANHGIELVEIAGGVAFAPKKDLWEVIKHRYGKKNDNRLSKAALETLSIIAYSQPITKGEIEIIRGVSADGMIKLLVSKEMIKEVGKKDVPGKPIQYGTTREFLKLFNLRSIADLPKLDTMERQKFEDDEDEAEDGELSDK